MKKVVFLNFPTHGCINGLLATAAERCARLPEGMIEDVEGVLRAAALAEQDLVDRIADLVDDLDRLLMAEGFDPQTSLPLA